jgi:hypothetical protein
MPFVRISLRNDTARNIRNSISSAVHRALVDTIGIPEGDRFGTVALTQAEDA